MHRIQSSHCSAVRQLRGWAIALALLLATLVWPRAAASQAVSPFVGDLPLGGHAVGFRAVHLWDGSRTWRPAAALDGTEPPGRRDRPVRASIWYPAARASRSTAMPYRAYVDIAGPQGFEEVDRLLAAREHLLLRRIVPRSDARERLLAAPVVARRDVRPARGRFPVVLLFAGLNEHLQHGNFVLAEFLASHGYVVVTVPQLGTTSLRLSLSISPAALETQIRDMEYALAFARRMPNVSDGDVAVVGHSMGGVASILLQMRNFDVDAVVGLDASYSARPLMQTLTGSPFYDVRRMRVPLFDIRRAANEELDSSAVAALEHSTRYLLRMNGVAHADFTSYPMIASFVPTDIRGRSPQHASAVYQLVCRSILAFLDDVFGRGTGSSLAALSRAAYVPSVVAEFTALHAVPAAIGADEAAYLISRDGVAATLQRYRQHFDANLLNLAGYRLLDNQRPGEALQVFEKAVELHPGSANAQDSLAEAYLLTGDVARAARAYRRVLELIPSDPELDTGTRESLRRGAVARLEELQAQGD